MLRSRVRKMKTVLEKRNHEKDRRLACYRRRGKRSCVEGQVL